FTPKAIVFDEDSQKLLLIPISPNEDLLQAPFDTSTGTFGTAVTYGQTGASEPIEGASYSPDGDFIYYSQGNLLYRIPTSDPSAAPQEIPLAADTFNVYDIKPGPDGQLY